MSATMPTRAARVAGAVIGACAMTLMLGVSLIAVCIAALLGLAFGILRLPGNIIDAVAAAWRRG